MISVTYFKDSADQFIGFEVSGHAGAGETRFSRGLETVNYLRERGVKYTFSLERLSFNQPLSSKEEAESFIRENYKNRTVNTAIEKTDGGYIAINRKAFGLFVISKEG